MLGSASAEMTDDIMSKVTQGFSRVNFNMERPAPVFAPANMNGADSIRVKPSRSLDLNDESMDLELDELEN